MEIGQDWDEQEHVPLTERDEEWVMRDEEARAWVESATKAVRSMVESTLGPKGMDTVIETVDYQGEPETVVTDDAAEIIEAIERGDGFNHPVAALFIDSIDSVQRGVHDGTTTATVLASALVEQGVELMEEGVHPGSVIVGYAMASNRAGEVLDTLAREVSSADTDLLRDIAATSMTADIAPSMRERYAELAAQAVEGLAESSDDGWLNTDNVTVMTGPNQSERIHRGQIIRRRPAMYEELEETKSDFDWRPVIADPIRDATVAVIEREIDLEQTASSFDVELDSATQHQAYVAERNDRLQQLAAGIADMDVDVLVSQEEVEEQVRNTFADHDITIIDRAQYPKSDIYRVADATGAQVVGHLDDIDEDKLGTAGRVVERRVGDYKWTYFDECTESEVFTIVLDESFESSTANRKRIVEDAVEVTAMTVMDGQALPGAGAPALAVAKSLRDFAPSIAGHEQLAVEAFADALEETVIALIENAGYDPLDTLADLRAEHAAEEGPAAIGIDAGTGETFDAWQAGIIEPRRVFSQAIETANGSAEQLLTIDAVLYPNVDLGVFEPITEHA